MRAQDTHLVLRVHGLRWEDATEEEREAGRPAAGGVKTHACPAGTEQMKIETRQRASLGAKEEEGAAPFALDAGMLFCLYGTPGCCNYHAEARCWD